MTIKYQLGLDSLVWENKDELTILRSSFKWDYDDFFQKGEAKSCWELLNNWIKDHPVTCQGQDEGVRYDLDWKSLSIQFYPEPKSFEDYSNLVAKLEMEEKGFPIFIENHQEQAEKAAKEYLASCDQSESTGKRIVRIAEKRLNHKETEGRFWYKWEGCLAALDEEECMFLSTALGNSLEELEEFLFKSYWLLERWVKHLGLNGGNNG